MRSILRRLAVSVFFASLVGTTGCVSPQMQGASHTSWERNRTRSIPHVCGGHGESMPIMASAGYGPQSGPPIPMHMMAGAVLPPPNAMPGGMPPGAMAMNPMMNPYGIQQASYTPMASGGPIMPVNNPGMPGVPGVPYGHNMPPGPMPGSAAALAMNQGPRFPAQRTQVRFVRPTGMKVSWFTRGPDGNPAYSNVPIETPGRYNFPQAAIYRLKLSNIETRPGLEVYPTMEVVPTNPKTESFLAHSAVPVEFTAEDFKLIAEGTYVVKVIYLPDPQFQDAASTGTEEILSTRLEPGVDPIQEACRRGSILLVIRMGNVDQEAPNTPPLNATTPGGGMVNPLLQNFGPIRGGPPGSMVPFGGAGMGPAMGPGAPMPPGLMTGAAPAPGAMPAITSMPMARPTPGMPTSRPGTASVSSPNDGPMMR